MLEINPSHKMIVALSLAQGEGEKSAVAKLVAEQILDNALIAAGLVDDPRMMLSRLNEILVATLTK
jgi:TNF receptor-associated protein 1